MEYQQSVYRDMQEGDEITLTYKAKVSGTQDPGLYKDIVYTYGTSILPEAEGDVLGVVLTLAIQVLH